MVWKSTKIITFLTNTKSPKLSSLQYRALAVSVIAAYLFTVSVCACVCVRWQKSPESCTIHHIPGCLSFSLVIWESCVQFVNVYGCLTLVEESTAAPLSRSSSTSSTWPSLAARWSALSPFWTCGGRDMVKKKCINADLMLS